MTMLYRVSIGYMESEEEMTKVFDAVDDFMHENKFCGCEGGAGYVLSGGQQDDPEWEALKESVQHMDEISAEGEAPVPGEPYDMSEVAKANPSKPLPEAVTRSVSRGDESAAHVEGDAGDRR